MKVVCSGRALKGIIGVCPHRKEGYPYNCKLGYDPRLCNDAGYISTEEPCEHPHLCPTCIERESTMIDADIISKLHDYNAPPSGGALVFRREITKANDFWRAQLIALLPEWHQEKGQEPLKMIDTQWEIYKAVSVVFNDVGAGAYGTGTTLDTDVVAEKVIQAFNSIHCADMVPLSDGIPIEMQTLMEEVYQGMKKILDNVKAGTYGVGDAIDDAIVQDDLLNAVNL